MMEGLLSLMVAAADGFHNAQAALDAAVKTWCKEISAFNGAVQKVMKIVNPRAFHRGILHPQMIQHTTMFALRVRAIKPRGWVGE